MKPDTKEFSWHDEDGNRIYAVEWPTGEPIAVLGIIHGIGEHSRRYDHLAGFFTDNRIACMSYDRIGHGRSEGKRGHAKDYRLFVDEAARLTATMNQRYPSLPVLLYGHSMGGQVLLRYLIRRNPSLTGAIVSAPHIRLPFTPNPWQVRLGKLMRRLKPDFTQPNPLELSQLSRDGRVGEQYTQDPLTHRLLSAQTGIDLLDNAAVLDAYAAGIKIPTLLMHGSADGITSADGSRAFYERNATGLTYKVWPGFYHELHNEPEWREVCQYVLDWMQPLIPKR